MLTPETKDNYLNTAFFTGVIEDVLDPEQMGRVRVRCFGYHTESKDFIPTTTLPWAHVMMPVTSASTSGVGQSPTGLVRGSWVVGFFRDGKSAQDPIIMGSLPSMSGSVDYDNGFSDPNQQYPYGDKVDDIDTPEEAVSKDKKYEESFSYLKKDEHREKLDPVPIAFSTEWELPPLDEIIQVEYPKNHVHAYERKIELEPVSDQAGNPSGILRRGKEDFTGDKGEEPEKTMHIQEFDVTPDFERVSTMHKSGTYSEWTPKGDETVVIVGDEYRIVVKNSNVNVKGNCNLTIEGNARTLIEGDHFVHVKGNRTELIEGQLQQTVLKNVIEDYRENHAMNIGINEIISIGGSLQESTQGSASELYIGGQVTSASGPIQINSASIIDLNAPIIDLNA
jgi:hypothetical protein